jgi:hypothetical protein
MSDAWDPTRDCLSGSAAPRRQRRHDVRSCDGHRGGLMPARRLPRRDETSPVSPCRRGAVIEGRRPWVKERGGGPTSCAVSRSSRPCPKDWMDMSN